MNELLILDRMPRKLTPKEVEDLLNRAVLSMRAQLKGQLSNVILKEGDTLAVTYELNCVGPTEATL